MRISTNTMFESGSARISELQSALMKTQQQIAANRRILTPADDPIAAARALEVTQNQTLNTQYGTNRQYANTSLSLEESVMQSVTSLLQDAQTQSIEAGNAAYDDTQRKYIATDLRGRLEELVGLANTRDSEGNYLFSGFQTATKPFSTSATGVQYVGDQGQRNLQVGTGRQMSISDSGDAVFSRIASLDTYIPGAASGNTGTAAATSLTVVDASLLTGHNYDVVFSGGGTTYSVYDITLDPSKAGIPQSTGAYSNPQAISFDGFQMTVTGVPANTDILTVRPSGTQSIFKTLDALITTLEAPTTTAINRQNLTHGLEVANKNLSSALDNILTVRASVGARLKELETMDNAGDDRDIQYAATLSQLQDLDYVKAISDLSLQKTTLEAAQQSYVKVMNLSLFNFL